MKVLVACEFSGVVREAFRALGHDAVSCDLDEAEDGGNHIRGDVGEGRMTPADIHLVRISKSDPQLQKWMQAHYSKPKGFVGRQIIYKITAGGTTYGAIAAGSATLHLPGRVGNLPLNTIVNNTFFHVEKVGGKYPCRNFTTHVVAAWREMVKVAWPAIYGDLVLAWETLVELPRLGELCIKDGWKQVGETKGYTCKRVGGQGTDSWTGKRVWDTTTLRPKRVFVRGVQ